MELTFNSVTDKEFAAVSDLIMNMYNQHLRRYYTEEGDANFTKQASIPELKRKSQKGCFLFIVKEGEDFIGVLEFNKKVLSQFFIVDEFRGRGYGRMTINWLKKFFKENKLARKITVQASPNAYLAFEKMGFEPAGEEKDDGSFISKTMSIKV